MPDIIILTALSFAIGVLVGPWLRNQWTYNRPVRCPQCGRWVRYWNTIVTMHRVAGRVNICRRCWQKLYRPGGTDEE